MKLKHRIKINVSVPGEEPRTILEGGECQVRSRKLSKLLGNRIGVLVLVPEGRSISGVVVSEDRGEEEK